MCGIFMLRAIGIVLIKLFMTKFITGTMFHFIPSQPVEKRALWPLQSII